MTTFLLALAVGIPLGCFIAGVAVVWAVDNHRDRKWAAESDDFTARVELPTHATHINPNKDRSLAGKARVRARKAARR